MHPILSNNTIIFAFINIFFLEGGGDAKWWKCEPPVFVANHRQSEEAEDKKEPHGRHQTQAHHSKRYPSEALSIASRTERRQRLTSTQSRSQGSQSRQRAT